jgi:hypothetical protein
MKREYTSLRFIYFVSGDIKTAKEIVMKNFLKFLGIIALAAVIGFSIIACGNGTTSGGGGGSKTPSTPTTPTTPTSPETVTATEFV